MAKHVRAPAYREELRAVSGKLLGYISVNSAPLGHKYQGIISFGEDGERVLIDTDSKERAKQAIRERWERIETPIPL